MSIELKEYDPNDFKKGILSGELRPHKVELTITFNNGYVKKGTVSWELIVELYKYHNLSAVDQSYQMLTESYDK